MRRGVDSVALESATPQLVVDTQLYQHHVALSSLESHEQLLYCRALDYRKLKVKISNCSAAAFLNILQEAAHQRGHVVRRTVGDLRVFHWTG